MTSRFCLRRAAFRFAMIGAALAAACGPSEQAGDRCGDGQPGTIVSGHGVIYAEGCDDGNRESGDGCDDVCLHPEPGWSCPEFGKPCVPRCGDGKVVGSEICDPGLPMPDAYCEDCTALVPGRCGDGHIDRPFEACDDANGDPLDGCSGSCSVELGFECAGEPSECTASGVSSGLQLEELDADEGGRFCAWLIAAFGGVGARHRCVVENVPFYSIYVTSQADCEAALEPDTLACASLNCTVGEVEAAVAASNNLCDHWGLSLQCQGRYLFEIAAICKEEPTGNGTSCEPSCR